MEQKSNSSPKSVCEKFCPVLQTIRRISHRQHDAAPRPASPAPVPSDEAVGTQFKQDSPKLPKAVEATQRHNTAELIPIKFDYSSHPPNGMPAESPSPPLGQAAKVAPKIESESTPATASIIQGAKVTTKAESPQVDKEEGKKMSMHIEDRFTEYINRAKIKIRSLSNIGDRKQGPGPGKDKFSEYINRTKAKIRTTSSTSRGRSSSFK